MLEIARTRAIDSADSVASPISPRWQFSWRQTNLLGSLARSFGLLVVSLSPPEWLVAQAFDLAGITGTTC